MSEGLPAWIVYIIHITAVFTSNSPSRQHVASVNYLQNVIQDISQLNLPNIAEYYIYCVSLLNTPSHHDVHHLHCLVNMHSMFWCRCLVTIHSGSSIRGRLVYHRGWDFPMSDGLMIRIHKLCWKLPSMPVWKGYCLKP